MERYIIFNNKKLTLDKKLLYRPSKPTDRDIDGKIVKPSYLVLVYSRNVYYEILVNGIEWVPDVEQAKQSDIRLHHTGINYGYTEWKLRHSKKGTKIDGEILFEYMQSTLYVMKNKKVYKTSVRRKLKRSEILRMQNDKM